MNKTSKGKDGRKIIDQLLIQHKINPLLFWGEYQTEIDRQVEFERQFRLNDAMKIKGVGGAFIDGKYLFVRRTNDEKPLIRISLRHTKEVIKKIIEKHL